MCVCARACVRVCMHTVSVSLCDLHCRRCALEFKNRESARTGARADCTPGNTSTPTCRPPHEQTVCRPPDRRQALHFLDSVGADWRTASFHLVFDGGCCRCVRRRGVRVKARRGRGRRVSRGRLVPAHALWFALHEYVAAGRQSAACMTLVSVRVRRVCGASGASPRAHVCMCLTCLHACACV